ncbi:hypothetical protein QQF64_019261 [Cirrhinus molitorella]|uniref:Uncharacterized protein n=1 Tax=Cirrhinus molitorella TaxID=172907 RepID=A0ABR3LF32_9TELE
MVCSRTDWKGEYVLDDKLKIKWCKPTELIPGRNETELKKQILSYINDSQTIGFAVLLSYSLLIIFAVCCIHWCNTEEPKKLSQEEECL